MDMEEFKRQFLVEAKEKLDEAGKYLDELQKGYDTDTLVSLKRSFHTLKGNSAAMGFQKYFELSKACNDLVQKTLDKDINLDSEIIYLFRQGKDKLIYALDYIESGSPEDFDDQGLIEKINGF